MGWNGGLRTNGQLGGGMRQLTKPTYASRDGENPQELGLLDLEIESGILSSP